MTAKHSYRKHRRIIQAAAVAVALAAVSSAPAQTPLPGGSLDPLSIPKYQVPLLIPPAMPRSDKINAQGMKNVDYYEIAVRQFQQQILPPSLPMTTVWSYGSLAAPGTVAEGGTFNYPAFTIESKWQKPARIKWVNDLVDDQGHYLPHLLPVDQTLHWANPPQDCIMGDARTDCRGQDPTPYLGPVPIITHVHGSESNEWSDGYPEAWYLPAADDIPAGYATGGSFFDTFRSEAEAELGEAWGDGFAIFQYPNDMRATTLWYHDHSLGITRLNVYAGPAGFYLIRGGPGDMVTDLKGRPATLPGPAPALGDAPGTAYYEIPIVIQDRSFNADGSLYYPDDRSFFEGVNPDQLQVSTIPEIAQSGETSDVSPIWNPEFFGNTMVVNGATWPVLEVEQRRYRFRFLNGCNSRFLILAMDNGGSFWQIGADGGFLPAPVALSKLLVAPAERADVIVDFGNFAPGTEIILRNIGPDEPFGGGEPGLDFDVSDPATTGQVMMFRVVATKGPDKTTPPAELVLPAIADYGTPDAVKLISLNEEESASVTFVEDEFGNLVEVPPGTAGGAPFGPTAALLGTVNADGSGNPLLWSSGITENPGVGEVQLWEIHNYTEDAHPIHIHLVQFQVVGRGADGTQPPEAWETGYKDTVIAYPDEITRVKARFDLAGLFVWHCHILEHEDNEMMRPYCVGTSAACQQHGFLGAP